MSPAFPSQARIVVIGGGVIGTSIAYNLAREGESDVVLLEKSQLTDGATWHAAGLVGQFRSQQNLTALMNDSVRLFDELAADTGQDPGWRRVGSIRLASSEARHQELLRSHSAARGAGFDMELLTPAEVNSLCPLLEVSDLVAGAFIPTDGHIDPHSLTHAYAKGFRDRGGRVIEGVSVYGFERDGCRLSKVCTDHGDLQVEIVINAAGLWARQVGWLAGVELPAAVVEHQYLVTEKSSLVPDGMPAIRDPDGNFYVKPEPGALAIGGWERRTEACYPADGLPWDMERHLFDANMERLEEIYEPALTRLPVLEALGLRTVINGPIPISPDGEPIMGPVPGCDNLFVACAFTSGIAASGGAGRALARWVLHGEPGLDLWPFDARRFGALHCRTEFLHERALESYSKYYEIHWPGEELTSARQARMSVLYPALEAEGAVFGSKFGWERANWFAESEAQRQPNESYDRAAEALTIGREHRAAREAVVIVDQSSFTKLEIRGESALSFLQTLCTANLDRAPGSGVYTQLCNERGGIEADVTIMRRAEHCFWLITGSGFRVRDMHWLDKNKRRFGFAGVEVEDISSQRGVINVSGPRARQVLERVTNAEVSNESFPFLATREIDVGYAPVLAFRVSYLGELGWELYVPPEYLRHVYTTLRRAGADLGMVPIGYRAIDSLRLEKRYVVWGADITPDYTPLEAGLGFVIDWTKNDFLGAEALSQARAEGITRKLVCLALDRPLSVFGGEAILSDGKPVAQTTSGNYGYTVGKSLVLGYLPVECAQSGSLEVEALGERCGATLVRGAAYDSKRTAILA